MQTDRALAPFAGQFVPLKVVTNGEPWSRWASKYRTEGNAIPIVYVIRSDGKMLFGKSGTLPGRTLPEMLLATLREAGRTFNDAEVALLSQIVGEAQQAIKDEDLETAAKALNSLSKIGKAGQLQSYSTLAQQADALVTQLTQTATASIEEAKAKLDGAKRENAETAFEAVLALVEAKRIYATFSNLKALTTAAVREVNKREAMRPLLEQAEAVDRARRYARINTSVGHKQALSAYEVVISRFPDTPAARVARQELASLAPAAAEASSESLEDSQQTPAAKYRQWTDSSGKYTTDAKLIELKDDKVRLKKRDGKYVTLPLKWLSRADRDYLQQRQNKP